ncbi:MAG: alanine--tRNA ligase [bacterium]|nr:alanine--tRNA ligase [bacterium]
MNAKQIRARFLEFYAERGHTVVASSSLVPQDDPTLIFTNAGMNQFKAVFLGLEKRDYVRAASCQKCMRVSGKHNDLEEVGRDARHHTFFEMLGNWSFGEYGKRESLEWGWDFLTREMGLDPARLWASVYKDDDDAYAIWRDVIKLPTERIKRLGDLDQGDEENFWSMGDTGPCGPCSEVYIDQGADMACDHPRGCALGVCDCDRWLELWNHVFMEFDRDETGRLNPLPMLSVDTGMGLERLVAVAQGVRSNFLSDLFTPLIDFVAELSGRRPEGEDRVSMQVIADHARAVTFAVTDGAAPANEGRGYVVRRILRRAARHGRRLELREPFLWRCAEVVVREMGAAYPELVERQARVIDVIRREEERFNLTLDRGLQVYGEMRDTARTAGRDRLDGADAFKLHDTFGFPLDLTRVIAGEDGLAVDEAGFAEHMERQRAGSGKERRFMAGVGAWLAVGDADPARQRGVFTGYGSLREEARALGVRPLGESSLGDGRCQLLCDRTPFYAESGGQIGDAGTVVLADGSSYAVSTTVADEAGPLAIVAADAEDLAARLRRDPRVVLAVGPDRTATMRHHTATHLLHAALRQVLGEHVTQAGSEVGPEKLRFDFHHDGALDEVQLARVEEIVNREVLANGEVRVHLDVPLAEARARGAMALFGEKYGETVRMIEIPGTTAAFSATAAFSLELCGGTHVARTGDIGPVRITAESSSAAGVRRLEAVAGERALALARRDREQLAAVRGLVRQDGEPAALVAAVMQERDELARELRRLKQQSAAGSLDALLGGAVDVAGVRVLAARVTADDRDALLALGDRARDGLGSGVVVLAAEWEGKATLLVTVTADLVAGKKLHAGNLVKAVAERVGGRGGGKPNTAQAGLPEGTVDAALAAVPAAITDALA